MRATFILLEKAFIFHFLMMDDEHVIAPVPMGGQERLVALQHLGASFHEGRRRISKVATPADDMDDKIPTFMDDKCVDNDDQVTRSQKSTQSTASSYLISDHGIKTLSFSTLC